jgi:hypothetical protein
VFGHTDTFIDGDVKDLKVIKKEFEERGFQCHIENVGGLNIYRWRILMAFKDLSFTTKFKLVAGNVLLIMGLVYFLTSGVEGVIMIVAGNLLHLDGRISKMEEENESGRK